MEHSCSVLSRHKCSSYWGRLMSQWTRATLPRTMNFISGLENKKPSQKPPFLSTPTSRGSRTIRGPLFLSLVNYLIVGVSKQVSSRIAYFIQWECASGTPNGILFAILDTVSPPVVCVASGLIRSVTACKSWPRLYHHNDRTRKNSSRFFVPMVGTRLWEL